MNKVSMSTLLIALAGTLSATAVWAQNAHFVKANGTINNDGEYVATFKEAGLGSGQTIHYTLAATGTFTYQCYTKSNNQPQGAPNVVSPSTLTSGGTFSAGKNGQITGSLTLVPEPDEGCQGNGLKLCLDNVSYQGVSLTDTDNNIFIGLPPLDRNFVVNGRPTNC